MKGFCIVLWFMVDSSWWLVQSKGMSCIIPELPKYSKRITQELEKYEDNTHFYYRCRDSYHFESGTDHHKIVCEDGHWKPIDVWKCFDDCNNKCGEHGTCMKTVGSKISETITSCQCEKNYAGDHCDARACETQLVPRFHKHPDLMRGTLSDGGKYSLGSVIQYRCAENYIIKKGQSKATCESTGWHPSNIPVCEVNTCAGGEFSDGEYTPIKSSYVPGQIVSFKCDMGFSLKGEPESVCTNGYWSPKWPTCVNLCARHELSHGSFRPNTMLYRPGQRVSFLCEQGFKLNGEPIAVCANGVWSPKWPTCGSDILGNVCGEPPSVQYAVIIRSRNLDTSGMQRYTVGASVTYKCNSRYYMEGNSKIMCQLNTHQPAWESPPRCYDVNACGTSNKVIIQRGDKYYCVTKPVITTTVTSTVKPLTIVTATAGALLLLLLIVISLVAYQRRRIAINNRRQGRERLNNEDDRYSFVYYSNDVHVVLPSYDEAMRVQGAPPPYRIDATAPTTTVSENVNNEQGRQETATASGCSQTNTEVIYDVIDDALLNANYIQGQTSITEAHSSNTDTPNETIEHSNTPTDRHNSNVLTKEGDTELDTDNVVNSVNRDNPVYSDSNSIDSVSSFSFVCDTVQLLED